MIIYNVSDTISKKWIYDCIISVHSVLLHNENEDITIYYDKDSTLELLQTYIKNKNVTFIRDSWTRDFCKKFGHSSYLGSGVYNIFKALIDFEDFYFFDTDVFCFEKISCTHDKTIGVKQTKGGYSRCITHVRGKIADAEERLKILPVIEAGKIFEDEILFEANFGDLISPITTTGVSHFGNNANFQKKKYPDKKKFENILEALKRKERISSSAYADYIKGVDTW